MIIYIDENISPYLAKGFRILQQPLNLKLKEEIDIRSIKEEFGQGAQDEQWIPIIGEKGACIITQDYNIKRTRHQHKLCNEYNLGVFYIRSSSKTGMKYWEMVKLMAKHWENINKIAISRKRPFAFRVTSNGKLEELP